MVKSVHPSPSLIPAILALIVLIALGYFLFTDLQPSRTEHTVSPPIEIEDPKLDTVTKYPLQSNIEQDQIIQKEAEEFVSSLSAAGEKTVVITENQGEFVRHDGIITIPKLEYRDTTVSNLMSDDTLTDETLLTLHYTETEESQTTLRELDQTIEDKTQQIILLQADGKRREATLADLLNNESQDLDTLITVITEKKQMRQLTANELRTSDLKPSQEVSTTINRGVENLSVKNIVQSDELPENTLFYLHRVTEEDIQGLWGIIQRGLIHRFRQGMSLEGIAPNKDVVRVTIPADADEPLPTGLSSFLGKILDQKVGSSYVYNFNTHTMGQDPNLIYPGQQLILIHFSPEELQQIYLFFAEQRNQKAQSFAIQH